MQLNYKSYIAEINYSNLNKCYCGRGIGITDVLSFSGNTVEEAEQEFKETIEDYLAWAKENNFMPQISQLN